jgi:cobalt/nickel transport system ATP-binding protein
MIALDDVAYRYPDGASALRGVSFELAAGERAVLLGANGCGKSTLLKLIGGLLFASDGEVRFRGRALTPRVFARRESRRRFRAAVGMVFQNPDAMLFNPTVREEIAYGPARLGRADADDVALEWARRFGLQRYLETAPFRLSGGEKQRLALACVLACGPELVLLDEPTANLDPRASGWLVDFLLEQRGLTTLVSTQNLSLAAELGRRALILDERGELIHDGDLASAMRDTGLLWRANLAHRHRHRHADGTEHRHAHVHEDWS